MTKTKIIIGLCLLFFIIGCNNNNYDPINRNCKVIEKDDMFDIELSGSYARVDDKSCCVVAGLDESAFERNRNYTIRNSFTYCTQDRDRGTVILRT